MDPTAQGMQPGQQPQAATEDVNPQPNEVFQGGEQGGPNEGINRRFAQLTAARREAERNMQQLMEQNRELMQTVQQMAMRQMQPAQAPDPFAHIEDPDERARAQAYVAPVMQQMQAMQAQLARQQAQAQAQLAVQQMAAGHPPHIVQRAQALLSGWVANGLQGWSPQDAYRQAYGEVAMQAATGQGQSPGQQGQAWNAGYAPVSAPSMAPPVARQPGTPPPLPANFHQLDAQQQADILEQRLGDISF